ncbi:MAG: DUF2149 domain-containing protein [Methanimicrococcus sp.]|nr:DUF2149 domain-containing protein [Methanimicrococcus sp.]
MSRKTRKANRGSIFSKGDIDNPMNSVGNVFDVAMVFSVALIVAIYMSVGLTEMLTSDDVTIVKNPGKENMQIIQKTEDGIEILEINAEEQIGGGIGEVLGTAYQLEDGRVIYVPEDNATIEKNQTGNETAG